MRSGQVSDKNLSNAVIFHNLYRETSDLHFAYLYIELGHTKFKMISSLHVYTEYTSSLYTECIEQLYMIQREFIHIINS